MKHEIVNNKDSYYIRRTRWWIYVDFLDRELGPARFYEKTRSVKQYCAFSSAKEAEDRWDEVKVISQKHTDGQRLFKHEKFELIKELT